ncbi:MAG: hypothetical protein K2Y33_13085, partial [Mycolicibacterium frederiksbergense]|nr:hypothetical protein [Mycolicibacterium frederiksbergense]
MSVAATTTTNREALTDELDRSAITTLRFRNDMPILLAMTTTRTLKTGIHPSKGSGRCGGISLNTESRSP